MSLISRIAKPFAKSQFTVNWLRFAAAWIVLIAIWFTFVSSWIGMWPALLKLINGAAGLAFSIMLTAHIKMRDVHIAVLEREQLEARTAALAGPLESDQRRIAQLERSLREALVGWAAALDLVPSEYSHEKSSSTERIAALRLVQRGKVNTPTMSETSETDQG